MIRSSHLVRAEEKKARRKIILSVIFLVAIGLLLITGGVPLLTKFSLLLTSGGTNKAETNQTNGNFPLIAPRLEPLAEATNTAKITVGGFANPGETVQLVVNGNETDKILVGNDGKFSITNVNLNEGDNNIYAKVVKEDKESPPSEMLKIAYKKSPPSLDISEPSDGQIYTGDNKTAKISGKTDPDVKITINDRLAIVASDGTFSYTLPLSDGDNQIKIVATDIAGNQTIIQRKAVYKS